MKKDFKYKKYVIIKDTNNMKKILFYLFLFFVFATPKSFAAVIAPTAGLDTPASIFVFPKITNTTVGYIDTSVRNKVKVCKDSACANEKAGTLQFPTSGFIDFNVASKTPLTIDSVNGIKGKVWGDELGWVTFNPPYGGVFFADPATGLLKGTAWSQTSGAINFAVTGQKVVIDPTTGEWSGWAWASGPYGGWIKFDCAVGSCVHSTWRGVPGNQVSNTTPSVPLSGETNTNTTDVQSSLNTTPPDKGDVGGLTGKILGNVFNNFVMSFVNIYKEITSIKIHITINDSAFTTSATNLKHLFQNMTDVKDAVFETTGKAISNAYDLISQTTNSAYKSTASFFTNIFKQNTTKNTQGSPVQIKTPIIIPVKPAKIKPVKIILPSPSLPAIEIKKEPTFFAKAQIITSDVLNDFAVSFGNLYQGTKEAIKEKSKIIGVDFNIMTSSTSDLFNKAGRDVIDAYNFLYTNSKNLQNQIFGKLGKIKLSMKIDIKANDSAFITSANNLQKFSNQMTEAKDKTFENIGNIISDGYFGLKNMGNDLAMSRDEMSAAVVETTSEKSNIMGTDLNIMTLSIADLFNKTEKSIVNSYDFVYTFSKNYPSYVSEKVKAILK